MFKTFFGSNLLPILGALFLAHQNAYAAGSNPNCAQSDGALINKFAAILKAVPTGPQVASHCGSLWRDPTNSVSGYDVSLISVEAEYKKLTYLNNKLAFAKNFELFSSSAIEQKTPSQCLTQEEDLVLGDYTGVARVRMNRILNGPNPTAALERYPAQKYKIETLELALDRLPNFVGTVYLGTDLEPAALAQDQVGTTVQYPAFTSTSKNQGFASGGNTVLTIHSLSGKAISGFSVNPSEEEVLFAPNAKFKVISNRTGADGRNHIELQELPRPAISNEW
jgi:hypothetical protein